MPDERVTVNLDPVAFRDNQTSVYLWLCNIGREPTEWNVYRGQTKLRLWNDQVVNGETVTLKPTSR